MDSNLKGIAVVLVLLGVIGVASYFAASRSKPDEKGLRHSVIVMCSRPECGKVSSQRILAGQPPPFACPRCGRNTAYRAERCLECGTVFPYVVQETVTEDGVETFETSECPQCRSPDFQLVRSMSEVKKRPKEGEEP
jgi:ssDNA-binding Zn-finger/Zn-ribbon topoisomerase 1